MIYMLRRDYPSLADGLKQFSCYLDQALKESQILIDQMVAESAHRDDQYKHGREKQFLEIRSELEELITQFKAKIEILRSRSSEIEMEDLRQLVSKVQERLRGVRSLR